MVYRNVVCMLCALVAAVSTSAQAPAPSPAAASKLVPPPAWAYNDLACAPEVAAEAKAKGETTVPNIRVIGSQDTVPRNLLGPGDTLVVSGGSGAGLAPGQRYFVRRQITMRAAAKPTPPVVHTAAWVQIQGVDETVATATVLHACDGILLDDYLEPFTPPTIAASPLPGTTPTIDNMGHIVTAAEGVTSAGTGQTMTIDRGSNAGVVVGQRFLVFRDKREHRMEVASASKPFTDSIGRSPLAEVGEVLVVSVRAGDATVQIVAAKDAVFSGDLVAPLR